MSESGSLTQPERPAAAALIPASLIKSRRVILVIRIISTVCGEGEAFTLSIRHVPWRRAVQIPTRGRLSNLSEYTQAMHGGFPHEDRA